MYVLIVAIHTVFFTTAHLLGYRIIEVIFLILGLFFLFYFSPLFFLDEEKEEKKTAASLSFQSILTKFSPKESILLPITLLYIAVYWFIFSVFWKTHDIFSLHAIIITSIYLIFIGYCLALYWKHDIFFEVFRFHTFFTLISTIIFSVSSPFQNIDYSLLHPFVGFIGIGASVFLLSYTKKENTIFLSSFLLAFFWVIYLFLILTFPNITLLSLLFIGVMTSFIIFEIFPKISFFHSSTTFFQYFSLWIILFFLPFIVYIAFTTIEALSIILLISIALFSLSVHTRYTNYIVFIISILDVYFIYSLLFSDLISHPSISSLFLFIFFLPILLIGTTYFWEEQHQYDFVILHYASIAFSIVYSIYILFFISWWGDLLFITSVCIFGIALLFFLSYFRFRTHKIISH